MAKTTAAGWLRTAACTAILAAGGLAAAQQAELEARGKQLYAQQRCTLCHSVKGVGNPKGSHDGVGSRLTPEEMRQWLLNPKEMAAKAGATRTPPMIPYGHLKEDEIQALLAYLSSLKDDKDKPAPKK